MLTRRNVLPKRLLGLAVLCVLFVVGHIPSTTQAFVITPSTIAQWPTSNSAASTRTAIHKKNGISPMNRPSTDLGMYNLPPPPSGGGNKDNLRDIATVAVTLLGVVAFFASPLGGIFWGLVNSLVFLSILTPILALLVFQVWTYFNTLQGPCPQCGAPVAVVKQEDSPGVCFNCGTLVQAASDYSGIELYQDADSLLVDNEPSSVWDSLFGGGPISQTTTTRTTTTTTPSERQSQYRRESTIIDVEVESDR